MTLSFIIPVYNGHDYIVRCLDSITSLAIPMTEYEVIVVDDCSTDDTREIVNDYIATHPQVHLLCQPENHRQGAARNRGLKVTKGEYIMFVDSDDEVASGLVETLDFTISNKLDMCFCTTAWQNDSGNFVPRQYDIPDKVIMSGVGFADNYYDVVCVGPWTYLWNRNFLLSANIPFIENRRMEDFDFVEKHIVIAKTIAYSSSIIYKYYVNSNSTVRTLSYDTAADWVHVCYRRFLFCETLNAQLLCNFIGKIEDQCKIFVSNVLCIRHLTRFTAWNVHRLLNRIGQNELNYLYHKNNWPYFVKLCIKCRWVVLLVILFAYPVTSSLRKVIQFKRKYKKIWKNYCPS